MDPKLEMEITFADKCISVLKEFYDIVNVAWKQEAVTVENVEKMQELRKKLPEQAQQFYNAVDVKMPEESFQRIIDLAPALPTVAKYPDFQRQNLQNLWHARFLELYYYQCRLKYRRELLQRLNLAKLHMKRFFFHPVTVIVLSIIVVYFLLLLLL